jgi:hypothetical protein
MPAALPITAHAEAGLSIPACAAPGSTVTYVEDLFNEQAWQIIRAKKDRGPAIVGEVDPIANVERLGVIMAPEPGDPTEVLGVLNPAVARGRDGTPYLFARVAIAVSTDLFHWSRLGLAECGEEGGFSFGEFDNVESVEMPGTAGRSRYSGGAFVLDGQNRTRVIRRPSSPLLTPHTPEETHGVVDNVVFSTGLDVVDQRTLDVYYGMVDARIGVARVQLREEATECTQDAPYSDPGAAA